MTEKEIKTYRVVCRDDGGEITLRTRAQDQYDAFEQIVMFLRKKEFDYQVILVELYRSTLPVAPARRANALR